MKKVALLFICLNPNYWIFLEDVIKDARQHFLKNHKVDFYAWSDIPELDSPKVKEIVESYPPQATIPQILIDNIKGSFEQEFEKANRGEPLELYQFQNKLLQSFNDVSKVVSRETMQQSIDFLRSQKDITVFPTDPEPWPFPTLMRYHLMLQQEEILKDYDYLYYMDVDMRIVDEVTDEIMGEGLTIAEHPMYSLRREYIPPYEPNLNSKAYIPRPGVVIANEQGQPWFKPIYAAGGFQGGTTESFLKAMKAMRKTIDADFLNNYTAIWNDESHWNRYIYDYTGPVNILSPSYVYPDSLIAEYYEKVWGKKYKPIIITLTKKFSLNTQGGEYLREKLATL